MGIKSIYDSTLTAIADAIRAKDGSSGTMTPLQMPQKIANIPTGGDTLSLAAQGLLAGELVLDYGSKFNVYPPTIRISSGNNSGITKITYTCIDGAKENGYPFGMASSITPYSLQEIDFGNLEVTYFALASLSPAPWANLIKVTANKLKALTNTNFLRDADALTNIKMPCLIQTNAWAFYSCDTLETVDLGNQNLDSTGYTARISNQCFRYSIALTALILRSPFMYALENINAFSNTPIESGNGYVYVPSALKTTYQAASNWVTYANQIRALEDYTVDGTVTGELDPTKI